MKNELARLDEKTLLKLFFDYIHLTILHYGLWFRETENQLGLEKTVAVDNAVWERILPSFIARLARRLDIPTKEGNFEALGRLSKKDLLDLLEDTQKNWLATDGVWFQTVEQNYDYEMFTAKRINDTCWTRLSYLEAKSIMRRFSIPENGGLAALKTALPFKLYSLIYNFLIVEEDGKVLLKIRDCRVQEARKRQGFADYPCKSAGITEHIRFAEAIDPRIKVRCVGCPPGPHPEEWWCAWEFSLDAAKK